MLSGEGAPPLASGGNDHPKGHSAATSPPVCRSANTDRRTRSSQSSEASWANRAPQDDLLLSDDVNTPLVRVTIDTLGATRVGSPTHNETGQPV